VVANDGQLGGALGRYAVNDVKAKSIAIIDDRTAYGQGVADEFEKAVKAAEGKVVGREFTTDKSTDFAAILTTLKARKPGRGLLWRHGRVSPVRCCVSSVSARHEGQLHGWRRHLHRGTRQARRRRHGGQAGRLRRGRRGHRQDKAAAAEDWKKRFKARFNTDVQLYAPYVYDAVMVMVSAMQKAGSSDPAKYLPELAKISYDGVTGKIAFDAKGDMKDGTLTLYTYKSGKKDTLMVDEVTFRKERRAPAETATVETE
jgi:branched-chain amino acid transport system substrate-binding protein